VPAKIRFQGVKATLVAAMLASTLVGCAQLPPDASVTPVSFRACEVVPPSDTVSQIPEMVDAAVKETVVVKGIKRSVVAADAKDLEKTVAKFATQHCNHVLVAGNGYVSALSAVSVKYPKLNFSLVTTDNARWFSDNDATNVSVFQIDQREAGLMAGYVSAAISASHSVAVTTNSAADSPYILGVKAGLQAWDSENFTSTEFQLIAGNVSEVVNQTTADVMLPFQIDQEIPALGTFADTYKWLLIGYGSDLATLPSLSDLQSTVGATVVPLVKEHVVSNLSASLEGDFIGGNAGYVLAQFGNGALVLSDSQQPRINTELRANLLKLCQDYESRNN